MMRQEVDFRAVDALTGDVAESPVPALLAAADEISGQAAEVERLRDENAELQIRNSELWMQVCDQSVELNALRAQLDRARAERDTLPDVVATLNYSGLDRSFDSWAMGD